MAIKAHERPGGVVEREDDDILFVPAAGLDDTEEADGLSPPTVAAMTLLVLGLLVVIACIVRAPWRQIARRRQGLKPIGSSAANDDEDSGTDGDSDNDEHSEVSGAGVQGEGASDGGSDAAANHGVGRIAGGASRDGIATLGMCYSSPRPEPEEARTSPAASNGDAAVSFSVCRKVHAPLVDTRPPPQAQSPADPELAFFLLAPPVASVGLSMD